MFAIPTLIRRASGGYQFHKGTLYQLPLELRDLPREKRYASLQKAGWVVGEFGYETFVHFSRVGDAYIVPGLMINGGAKIIKKFPGYSSIFAREHVESYARGLAEYAEDAIDIAQQDLNMLIHDLRRLSTSIYHSAAEASRFIIDDDLDEALKRIENVKASQAMLAMRTDALDLLGNPASITVEEVIPIYKKVDKVVRCYKSDVAMSKKTVNLHGLSTGRTFGPAVFEIVPYTLIDNAVKYSPEGGRIDVHVSDENQIAVSVSSLGPKIDSDETELIFQKGARGRHARSAGIAGTGVGLHLVAKIVKEYFGGSVEVVPGESPAFVDGLYYYRNEFVARLPYKEQVFY